MPRLQVAYYYDSVENFLSADPEAIYGQLGKHHAHSQELAQRSAWLEQIRILQRGLQSVPEAWIAFEFAIPRMGKRADVIIVLAGIIFVIEFKIDAEAFTNAAIEQAIDYASDLKDFHETSHDRIIIPVVIATDAPPKPVQLSLPFPPYACDKRDMTAKSILTRHNAPHQYSLGIATFALPNTSSTCS